MDCGKIGRLIAQLRREKGRAQASPAETLRTGDRSIYKRSEEFLSYLNYSSRCLV